MKVNAIKPDNFDLERLKETVGSEGYALIAARARQEIERQKNSLLTVEAWENVRYVQGFAAGLMCALDIPGILAADIKARTKA